MHTIHLSIIPNGNRRWAKLHKVSLGKTYIKVAEHLYDFVFNWCIIEHNLKYVTAFGMSYENYLNRGERWRSQIFNILNIMCERLVESNILHQHKIRIKVLGDRRKLPKEIFQMVKDIEEMTSTYHDHFFTLAMVYGGRQDILQAVRQIVDVATHNKMTSHSINMGMFEQFLSTANIPDADILIRTGEHRISNFFIWNLAYTEMYFLKKYFLDFTKHDLDKILRDFYATKRRFGE